MEIWTERQTLFRWTILWHKKARSGSGNAQIIVIVTMEVSACVAMPTNRTCRQISPKRSTQFNPQSNWWHVSQWKQCYEDQQWQLQENSTDLENCTGPFLVSFRWYISHLCQNCFKTRRNSFHQSIFSDIMTDFTFGSIQKNSVNDRKKAWPVL